MCVCGRGGGGCFALCVFNSGELCLAKVPIPRQELGGGGVLCSLCLTQELCFSKGAVFDSGIVSFRKGV